MQDEFDNEKTTEADQENNQPDTVMMTEEERIMAEQAARIKKEENGKKLRFAANRIGWATVVLVVVWMGILLGFTALINLTYSKELALFYQKYYVIINEASIALAMVVAYFVLRAVPKADVQPENFSAGRFFKLIFMCFGAGYIGNQIGTVLLSFWNSTTHNSVGGELTELLADTNPLFVFISVGILAPIIEELFFRKLLTDRLQALGGEKTAIIIPAFLFALFHQSASQLVYAFFVGIFIGYFYCRTGKYWLAVIIHAVFNIVSGVIPVLYLPKVARFLDESQKIISADTNIDSSALAEQLTPLVEQYGLAVCLFLLHSVIVFVINILGIIFIVKNFKKYKEREIEHALSFGESFNIIFRTPGIFVCTMLLSILTIISLFA